MNSRLLSTLDARIKTARDPVENACLRAEKAALLARQGRLDAARAELRDLRSRFDSRPHAAVSAWASLAEGLVAYFEDLNASARDKFKRALALSQSFKSPAIEALSAAWLAQADYLAMDFESMTRHLVASFQVAPVTLHSARSRASLVVAEAHVGKNQVMKRIRARARGRAAPMQKPFSQLTIVLRDTSMEPEAA